MGGTKVEEKNGSRCVIDLCIGLIFCLLIGSSIGYTFYRLYALERRYAADISSIELKIALLEKRLTEKEVTIDADSLINQAREKRENTWDDEAKVSLTIGRDGSDGIDGAPGTNGVNGRDGRDGKDGSDGRDGRDGKSCDCDLGRMLNNQTGLMFGVRSAEIDLNIGATPVGSVVESSGGGGTTYVRWGRNKCGNSSSLIYNGVAAGSYYSHSGGGSNYQCLPRDPELDEWSTSDTGGYIYGTEYETYSKIFPSAAQDQNVPCARCYAPRSAQMMIPGKKSCPESWTKEYEGYLMSAHRSHQRSTYECVDQSPEYLPGQLGNKNGALFYFQQASCSYLGTCPPYVEGAELTCVVCTK